MIEVSRKQFQFMRKKNFLRVRAVQHVDGPPSVQGSSPALGGFKQQSCYGDILEGSQVEGETLTKVTSLGNHQS